MMKRFKPMGAGLAVAALAIAGLGGCKKSAPTPPMQVPGQMAQPAAMGANPMMPAPPAVLTVGAPPVGVQVPIPPQLTLNIAQPGEYQIDAIGAPMDSKMHLYLGDQLVETDDDGGDGANARIVRFLQPGMYNVRVSEYRARAMTAQVQAALLPPLTPAGTLMPGAPLMINTPHAMTQREASAEVVFTITTPGMFQIDAVSTTNDPKIALIFNNGILEENDDGGDGNNARIRRQLMPGQYRLRVWDLVRRATPVTITLNPG